MQSNASIQTSPPRTRTLSTAILSVALAGSAFAQAPEFRAMWVSRFEWPDANPAVAQARINNIMDDLANANFNAVFFQVRGQADTLYPSPEEVWSPLLGGGDPGWDPLAYAISAAHARDIEFHAYINTHTCWQSGSGTPPSNPNHIFYDHCNASDPARRDWLHHNTATNPVQYSESDYVWFAPGVPDYQAYVRRQVLYVVENYDVDGVHYDRIRTPWSGQPSFDPISTARFNSVHGNPDSLDLTAWTADQINRTVYDIYAAIQAVKPHVKVSAAVFPNPFTSPANQHQEAVEWAVRGGLDIAVPMIYGESGTAWNNRLSQWLGLIPERHVVGGQITSQGLTNLLNEIGFARSAGAEGTTVFSWSSFPWFANYLGAVYQQPVATPVMPWKQSPTTAVIHGYVRAPGGASITDALVNRDTASFTALSSGDGFYSFLLVEPGTHTLTARFPGFGDATQQVTVAAGDVVAVDLVLGAPPAPLIAEVTPDPDTAVAAQPYEVQLSLIEGIADSWALLDGPPGADVDANGRVFGWTPSVGDIGMNFTFTVRASNSEGFDDEEWTARVAAFPPCDAFKLTDFESYSVGERVLFNTPGFSGSTNSDLAAAPDVTTITDSTAFSGSQSTRIEWAFIDTDPQRWVRLTTFNAPDIPNPIIAFDRPIRVRLRLDSGALRVTLGVRETNTGGVLGDNGGASGAIEWIGAATDINGAPQGKLVTAQPGVWQTLIFDPLTDPLHTLTGDGALQAAFGFVVLEHLAFTVVDDAGPFTVYLDDIDQLCGLPVFGDYDVDGDVDDLDLNFAAGCINGPDVAMFGACTAVSNDGDGDGDLHDLALLQLVATGDIP